MYVPLGSIVGGLTTALPELYPHGQPASSHCPGRPSSKILAGKPTEHNSADENTSQNNKRKYRKTSKLATNSVTSAKGRQPTIMDVLKKEGVLPSVSNDDSSGSPVTGTTSESSEQVNTYESEYVEVSASTKYLEVYRCKFRPILVECFSMLSFSQARPLLTRALEEGNFDSLVDSRLRNNYNQSEMSRMVSCAAVCVRHSARRRPRMSQVTVFAYRACIGLNA
ncbi:hypothetical protein POM88_006983 [Heracleum sosnowskyi]|uniref:non-specific serine/threonine protein kinase n=1 Tax=Heracleum sosnowskyi TaxID=360622 RepID=A0AAD8J7B6_9APIA|nr:hypothetical protein POM88_006983 [Heracleum sosnowskyi]